MTQEQFEKAFELQTKIENFKNRNEELEKIINLLNENGNKGYTKPDIRILLNDSWSPTKGTIDYHDLLNFLNQQKNKNNKKIEKMQEEFDNI